MVSLGGNRTDVDAKKNDVSDVFVQPMLEPNAGLKSRISVSGARSGRWHGRRLRPIMLPFADIDRLILDLSSRQGRTQGQASCIDPWSSQMITMRMVQPSIHEVIDSRDN
jgi:hypothetical protein